MKNPKRWYRNRNIRKQTEKNIAEHRNEKVKRRNLSKNSLVRENKIIRFRFDEERRRFRDTLRIKRMSFQLSFDDKDDELMSFQRSATFRAKKKQKKTTTTTKTTERKTKKKITATNKK